MWLTVYWHELDGAAREAVDELVSFMSQMYPVDNYRRFAKQGRCWREYAFSRHQLLKARAKEEILRWAFGDGAVRLHSCSILIRVPIWVDLTGSRALYSPWIEYRA